MPVNIPDNKALLENIANATINTELEKDKICFRFNDLTDEARTRFVERIIANSAIWTVRTAKLNDAKDVLEIANPILIRGGYGWKSWSHSTIFRWGELRISRIIYYTLFREIKEHMSQFIAMTIASPGASRQPINWEPFNSKSQPRLCQLKEKGGDARIAKKKSPN